MSGCKNYTESHFEDDSAEVLEEPRENLDNNDTYNPLLDDVLVVRRETQTVRAIEPRSGSERWNFSIGHHEIEMLKSQNCHPGNKKDDEKLEDYILDLDLRVVVPEGMICAFSKKNPGNLLWKHQVWFSDISINFSQ
jgi:translation initiation factor 2-alpha kinase 3